MDVIIVGCDVTSAELCRSAAFTPDSLLISYQSSGYYYLGEYNIAGNFLQPIDLPTGKLCAGCQLTVDSTGGIVLLPMYNGSSPSFNNYGYAYNIQGAIADTTAVTGVSQTTSAMVMDGQDTWFNVGGNIVYQSRTATGSGVTIYSNANTITYMQLIGTKLYALIGSDVSLMSPIVKSGTGTFSTVLSSVTAFYISGSSLYTYDGTFIKKYTLDAQGTTPTFQYQFFIITYAINIKSLYSTTVLGTTYLMMAMRDINYSELYSLVDTGSAFSSISTIVSANKVSFYSVGPSPKPTCSDTFKNQDETDVDCGGAICGKCSEFATCKVDGDCSSGYCNSALTCVTPTCSDGVKNQDETDIDCGGATCNSCANGKKCTLNGDCASYKCSNLVCADSCTDGLVNQDETDVDCGGAICGKCDNTKTCALNTDCTSTYCNPNSKCSTLSCDDGFKNQDETDVDCGGVICLKCANTKICTKNTDCTSAYCNPSLVCSTPSCNDGIKNQDESDIDCGGSTGCDRCSLSKQCNTDSDCASNTCNTICINAPVAPIAPPVSAPVSSPSKSSPISTPTITPVAKVSTAVSVAVASFVGFVVNLALLIL